MSTTEQRKTALGKESTGRRRRPARVWHRWIGTLILAPLLFVAVTGVLLNHTTELGWDENTTDASWILNRYGMQLEGQPVSFESGSDDFASSWDGQLFWNGSLLEASGKLIASVPLKQNNAIILDHAILLLAPDGSLIEEMGEESLPQLPLSRAGISRSSESRLVVESGDGSRSVFSDDLLAFEASDLAPDAVSWRIPAAETPSSLREEMKKSYRGEGVPWSRVLLDMHSGKFFGEAGRWIADAVVVLLIVLSLTGLRLLLRNRRPAGSARKHVES